MAKGKSASSEAVFLAGATTPENIPTFILPEVAFWGKSNVGKSSLINAVTKRKLLARVSHTPGRTKQLNFFEIDGKMIFVDMPGYGYAKVSKSEKASWQRLIKYYLAARPNLRRVFFLLDSRHTPKESDEETMSLLDDLAVSYQMVLTKYDKKEAKTMNWPQVFADLERNHSALFPEYLTTSSRSGLGVDSLRAAIAGACGKQGRS